MRAIRTETSGTTLTIALNTAQSACLALAHFFAVTLSDGSPCVYINPTLQDYPVVDQLMWKLQLVDTVGV